jgi:very-short-patch-repair endonuclease
MRKFKKLPKILQAREFRKEPTEAERVLWEYLRDRRFFGKKFRRQHILRGFVVDFYCFEDRLAVELDGPIHLKQKDYDNARQNILKDFRIKILRFKNDEVLRDAQLVLRSIKNHLTIPSPSPMERDEKK